MKNIETPQQNVQMNIEGIKQLSIMYNNLGTLEYEKKNYKKALGSFEEALKYYDILYRSIDKTSSANTDFINILQQQILDTKIYIITVSQKLGDEKFNSNDYYGALEYYKNIISCNIDEKLCEKVSQCLIEIGAYVSAVSFLSLAVELNPQNTKFYFQIADIFDSKLEDYNKALFYYDKYTQAETNDNKKLAEAYCTMGHLYEILGKYENIDKQIEYFQKSLDEDPSFLLSLRNLTIAYIRSKRYQEALDCFKKIFELGATMDDFFEYACLNIRLKNFKEGWKYYEYRFSKENGPTYYPKMPKPKWKGEDITDKTLLVHYEQGFGDVVQFFRYVELLKPLAKKIVVMVQKELVELLKINIEGIEVYGPSQSIEQIPFDCHIPLMSLPRRLEASVDNIPCPQKYISADNKKVEEYRKNYFNNDKIKIGICWHGAQEGFSDRNIPFETFFELNKLENVQLYSFQKNITVEELDKLPVGLDIVKLGRTFNDFSDTAAALANLDLFVASDNSVFNLAGAMGVKTSLLLNSNSEWRWFTDDETTPWYENVRIYRKENELDSWDSLMKKVVSDISAEK